MTSARVDVSYEYLRPFCKTARQEQVLDAIIASPSVAAAAQTLNIKERNTYAILERIKRQAASAGVAPDQGLTHQLPSGQRLKGASTLYDADGEVKLQWVKSDADAEAESAEIEEVMEAFRETVDRAEPVPAPAIETAGDLLNFHVLTDFHMGMKAWREETGDDWDLKIAEDLLVRWFAYALERAPDAAEGVLAQMGDFLHWDSLDAVTPTGKHLLQPDTRYQKVVRVAIRSLRRVIALMLEKYPSVHIIMAEGNHDMSSSAWLREMFSVFYEDEPRITVDNSADIYYCKEWGQTSLFVHHGHKRRPANIADVFASKFREVWGRTKYSYAHLGHMHHVDSKEGNLMIVEQHRTMAANDSHAARGGWSAGRSAPVISYHREFGQVGRQETSPEMVLG